MVHAFFGAAVDPVPSVIAAVASLVAASIGAYALSRAQSYKQLLRDIQDIVQVVLEKQLAAEQRGPAIARYVEETMRRVITDLLGHDQARGHKRRWYDP